MQVRQVHDPIFGKGRVHRDVKEATLTFVQHGGNPRHWQRLRPWSDELQATGLFGDEDGMVWQKGDGPGLLKGARERDGRQSWTMVLHVFGCRDAR
jgi:hypothetical protein